MANTKSALKNIRKNRTRYLRNRAVKSRLKTLEKSFRSAVEAGDAEAARQIGRDFVSALDRARKNSLVHANKVSRKKACFAQALAGLQNAGGTSKAKEAESAPAPDEEQANDNGG